ncbi:glycine zipper domain-containing protein, partial [Burkholderia sp. LMG 13014]
MLKKLAGMAVVVGAAAVVSLPAVAGDTSNALGGALGGVAGAAVGNAIGGSTGTVIGGAVGGGAGGAVTSNKRERTGA